MFRVTADTNILVSAIAYPRGNPRRFLQIALAGEINLAVSRPIVDEIVDVLTRRFGATPEDIAEARAVVSEAARTVVPSVRLAIWRYMDFGKFVSLISTGSFWFGKASGGSDTLAKGNEPLCSRRLTKWFRLSGCGKRRKWTGSLRMCGARGDPGGAVKERKRRSRDRP